MINKINKNTSNKDFYNSAGITDINDPLKPNTSNFAVERFYEDFKYFIKKGDSVLDLGCNAGRFSFFCEEKFGANVLGIDFSNIAIDYAKKVAKIKKSKCKFEVKNYNNLSFDKKFDVVIFPNNIIECSYLEFENICKQVKNIIKTNGKFILSCPLQNFNEYLNQQGLYDNLITIPDKGEFNYYTYFYNPGFINYILSKFFQVEVFKILNYKNRNNKITQNYFFVAV